MDHSRPNRGRLRQTLLLTACVATFVAAGPAAGQEAAAEVAPAQPSLVELKASAYDAQEAARQAEAAAAQASAAAEAARQAVGQASGAPVTPAPAVAAEPAPPPPPPAPAPAAAEEAAPAAAEPAAEPATPDPTLEALHRATEEAKNAAAAARAATAALQEHVKEEEGRFSRNGFFLSGGVFWAPELFDTTASVGDSKGAFGAIGYHFGERFDVEARYDILDEFSIVSPTTGYVGHFDGWTVTLNGRIFLLTKTFQPYLGMGIGVMDGKTSYKNAITGRRLQFDDTVATFRVSTGFDYYVSESFAITADASVNMPGGEISAANYATLGGGIKLRF